MITKYQDHLLDQPCTVTLHDGTEISGVLDDEYRDSIRLTLLGGRHKLIYRCYVKEIRAQETAP